MELLSLRLSAIDETRFKVFAHSDKEGQAEADSSLPFIEPVNRRTTLIKALEVNEFRSDAFQLEEQDWLVAQEWLSDDRRNFHPGMLARIGQAMYDSLFPTEDIRVVLQKAIGTAEKNRNQLHIRLEFNAYFIKNNRLPDYPWELAYCQRFLAHHQIIFSRYIAHASTVPHLPTVEQLKVLLVASGASDSENGLMPLSNKEQKAIFRGLEKARAEGHIHVDVLETATLNHLRTHLTEQTPHIVHFDGHGLFGRRCNISTCRKIHRDLRAEKCRACGAGLPEPQGYLLFETEEDEVDYISAIEFGELLQKTSFRDDPIQRGITVAVLSACKSGMALGGESAFNGMAQRLINHQIPAVVAMQYSIRVDAASQFSEQFYRSLGCRNSLATAVSQGQEAMGAEGNQWYRPVLYLRWQSNEGGKIFASSVNSSHTASQQSASVFSREINLSLSNFPGCINWIYKNSQTFGIRKLNDFYRQKLEAALYRVGNEGHDFKDVELEVLELVVHYNFYCLESRYSGKFGRMPKKEYYARLKNIINSGRKIRSGNIQLSSLINEKEMSQLISKLEVHEY